jgi:hypothetical protein
MQQQMFAGTRVQLLTLGTKYTPSHCFKFTFRPRIIINRLNNKLIKVFKPQACNYKLVLRILNLYLYFTMIATCARVQELFWVYL